jgi:hypothetical protein
MSQPSDEHEEDTIIETIERGYVLNGELARPDQGRSLETSLVMEANEAAQGSWAT